MIALPKAGGQPPHLPIVCLWIVALPKIGFAQAQVRLRLNVQPRIAIPPVIVRRGMAEHQVARQPAQAAAVVGAVDEKFTSYKLPFSRRYNHVDCRR
jgi:hypothetical protein